MGRKMDAIRSKSGLASEAEAPVRSLVKTTEATELCSDVLRAGAASVTEIEKLIGQLQRASDYLHTEGERLQREATRYAQLTQTALASVTTISDRMNKWREAAVAPSTRETAHTD
jgi:hypothetical protein